MINVFRDSVVGVMYPQREFDRDCEEIRSRAQGEGLSFLTRTLPSFAKSVDTALATGSNLSIIGFKKSKNGKRPSFLGSLTGYLFDDEGREHAKLSPDTSLLEEAGVEIPSGEVLSCNAGHYHCREAAVIALRAIRQVCYLYYKLQVPYTREQQEKVINDFVTTDEGLAHEFAQPPTSEEDWILTHARHLICRVLGNSCPSSGIPRHGPGAVATGERSPEKHVFKRFYRRLDDFFKYDQWFYLNGDHLGDSLQEFLSLEELEAGTAKVVLVPKDSRGPRLISCEPLEYQWIQQALCGVLVDAIENHPLTRGFVNFTDQAVNGRLALEGSLTGEWSTLDMKEASDRVSLWLVARLFPERWFHALYASRSESTTLPDGTILPLNKFAPMGSATCFPVEALIFWALSVATARAQTGNSQELPAVYVYGDDVICSRKFHVRVMRTLSSFGLRLNESKCCTHGSFRESCGVDAYLGHIVTPVRMRTVLHPTKKSSDLVSHVAFSNALWAKGLRSAATYVEEIIQKTWNHSIPVLWYDGSGVVAFVREYASPKAQPRNVRLRFNRKLHRVEVKGLRLRTLSLMTKSEGFPLCLRILAKCEREVGHLGSILDVPSQVLRTGEYAMAKRVKLTLAWSPLGN